MTEKKSLTHVCFSPNLCIDKDFTSINGNIEAMKKELKMCFDNYDLLDIRSKNNVITKQLTVLEAYYVESKAKISTLESQIQAIMNENTKKILFLKLQLTICD